MAWKIAAPSQWGRRSSQIWPAQLYSLAFVGDVEGERVVGRIDGLLVGPVVGIPVVGALLGLPVGLTDGAFVGWGVGDTLGIPVGLREGGFDSTGRESKIS